MNAIQATWTGTAFAVLTSAFLMAALGLQACGAGTVQQGSPVDVGIDTAVCVLRVSIEDELAGMQPEQIIVDCSAKCGATAAQVVKVRAQYAASRARERSGAH